MKYARSAAALQVGSRLERSLGSWATLLATLLATVLSTNSANAQSDPEPVDPTKAADQEEDSQEPKPAPDASAKAAATQVTATQAATPQASSDTSADEDKEEEDTSAGLDDLSLVDLLQLDLRVASTKTDTTVQASPASVTIVTRQTIERYGYRSVAEALRDVVGTYAVDDHITPNLGVRGVPGAAYEGSGAVKVMIDGVPVSFRTTGENWLGPSLVPMASVERIEIIKGPTSSLYGADAFLGVINVITKDGAQKNWGEVGVSGLSTYSGKVGGHAEAAGGLVWRPWRLTLGAQVDQEDRSKLAMPKTSPAPSFADTATDASRGQILRSGVTIFNLSYTPTRQTSVSMAGRYAQQQSHAEFAPWLQFTNVPGQKTGTQSSLQQGSLTLKAGSNFTRNFRLEVTGTGFFGGTLPGDRVDTGDTLALAHRRYQYAGGQGTVESIITPIKPLRFVLGVEASADHEVLGDPEYRSREDGSELPGLGPKDETKTTLVNLAARGQMTWQIIPDYLVPTGGLRFDRNSVYGDKVSGRIALVSRVHPALYLKTSYGTAFKAATPLLLYGQPLKIGDIIGSPELGAQEMRAFEITADYRPKKIADFEVTVSRWNLIDRAVFRPEQINLIAKNAGDASGWTIEAQASSHFSEFVGTTLGFEWVHAKRESDEVGYRKELFGTSSEIYPSFIVRNRIWVQPKPLPIELWTALNIVGPRNASDSNTLEAGTRYQLPTYATLDAGLRTIDLRWLGKRLTEFSVRAQNLTNTAGASAGFFGIDYPAAPPKVLLEVRQEL